MGSILIAMPRSEDAGRIARLVQSNSLGLETEICVTGAEILRISNERDFGVVICSKQLRDMNYTELGEYLPMYFGMILLTSDASVETPFERCVKLLFPMKRTDLLSTIEMMTASFHRQRRKRNQIPPKRSKEEMQMIERAKALLMDRNGMSEPEAFRYLQKNSMDYGRSMVESAQMVLVLCE